MVLYNYCLNGWCYVRFPPHAHPDSKKPLSRAEEGILRANVLGWLARTPEKSPAILSAHPLGLPSAPFLSTRAASSLDPFSTQPRRPLSRKPFRTPSFFSSRTPPFSSSRPDPRSPPVRRRPRLAPLSTTRPPPLCRPVEHPYRRRPSPRTPPFSSSRPDSRSPPVRRRPRLPPPSLSCRSRSRSRSIPTAAGQFLAASERSGPPNHRAPPPGARAAALSAASPSRRNVELCHKAARWKISSLWLHDLISTWKSEAAEPVSLISGQFLVQFQDYVNATFWSFCPFDLVVKILVAII